MESLSLDSRQERVAGISDEVLLQAALAIAGNYNEDLRRRVEEVVAEGGDALTFLGACIPGASKDAIELAQQISLAEIK